MPAKDSLIAATALTRSLTVATRGSNRSPLWSRDGRWIYYASDQNGTLDVWRRRADLGGPAELVYGPPGNQVPIGLAADGTLVFVTLDFVGSTISKVDPAMPQDVSVLVDRPMDAPDGALSPDERFLAYQVLETRVWQIRILDLSSGRHTTVADGFSPMWSPEGTAVFYQSPVAEGSALMMMPFSPGTGGTGRSSVVFSDFPIVLNGNDIAADGRALVLVPTQPSTRVSVVLNWPALVRGVR